jgi:hypothetical protein
MGETESIDTKIREKNRLTEEGKIRGRRRRGMPRSPCLVEQDLGMKVKAAEGREYVKHKIVVRTQTKVHTKVDWSRPRTL